MAAQSINNMNACILVICPLTNIIKDQITETRSPGIKRVSLLEISFLELKESAFEIVFYSAERVMEKEFSEPLSSRCQISNFWWNLISLSYSCGFRGGSEKNTEIVAGSLSRGFAWRGFAARV